MIKKTSIDKRKVSMDYNGKTYQAKYYIESKCVTIEAISDDGVFIEHTTQIGGGTAETVARMLLRELIDSGRITGA